MMKTQSYIEENMNFLKKNYKSKKNIKFKSFKHSN